MEESNKTIWEHSPFMELFSSAVFFLQKALTDSINQNLFARESIVNCVFALEASANCLLDKLELSKKFKDDIDKLATTNKFELFLMNEFPGKKIERGNTIIQKIDELINIRNKFVHPRHVKVNGDFVGDKTYQAKKITKKNATQISNLSTQWKAQDAKNSVQIVIDFYLYFFTEICGYTDEEVSGILCTKNHYSTGPSHWIISSELMTAFKVLTELDMLKKNFMKVPDGDYDISFVTEQETDL